MRQWLALALVAASYAAIALGRPADVFWSPDQGSKLLQVWALLEGRLDLSLEYPGRAFDPELSFRPYIHSYVRDGAIQVPWPMAWVLPAAALYALIGRLGLSMLPVAGGLIACWCAGRLAERIRPGSGWLAVLLAGLATPLFVYSTLFWEHAPATGLFALGLASLTASEQSPSSRPLVAAGLCFGLACAWRAELYLFATAALLSLAWSWPREQRAHGALLVASGALLTLIPHWLYNLVVTGHPITRSSGLVPLDSPTALAWAFLRVPSALLAWPADLLVGARTFGLALPEPLRWAPAVGLALLVIGRLSGPSRRPFLQMAGLAMAGSASLALLLSPAPQALHGLLVSAPWLSAALLTRKRLWTCGALSLAARGSVLGVLLVALAATALHRLGLAGGELEWGPRFLLPAYPPLAALAAAVLVEVRQPSRPVLLPLLALLVALGLGLQLAGLAQIAVAEQRIRAWGQLIAGLPGAPVVLREGFISQSAVEQLAGRELYCADSPDLLRAWSAKASAAGRERVWFVDFRPLPDAWLVDGRPTAFDTREAANLRASQYDTAALAATLRDVRIPPPATRSAVCAARLDAWRRAETEP